MRLIPRPWSRRQLLAGAGIAATCWALPARAQPTPGGPANNVRDLLARTGTTLLRGDSQPATPLWTFDGSVPGPILRARRGEELRLRLRNELPQATCVHWHGVRSSNAMDGVAHLTQAPIAPGTSFDYRFRLPDAGTFWYHPAGNLAAQTGRGLRGALIVDEPEPVGVDRDLLLFLEDWSLAADGTISHGPEALTHWTSNGAGASEVSVRTHERLRLRIVNAAMARTIALRVEGHTALVVAIDGQPSEPFPARDSRVALGPGNRIDLFIDAELGPGARAAITAQDGRGETALIHLVYAREAARSAPLPAPKPLPSNRLPERLDLRAAARHDVWVGSGDVARPHERAPLFSVRRGRTVVLTCGNRTELAQSVHLHGHHCRWLDRLDDGWKPFWLDTMMIGARQTERIAFLADNPGKWLIESQPLTQPLAQPPAGAAVWFDVT